MGADELLRRYLEQRREMGETELVLDGMDVDEVLRVIGARRVSGSAVQADSGPLVGEHVRPLREVESTRPNEYSGSADWREALRDAGAAPGKPAKREAPPEAQGVGSRESGTDRVAEPSRTESPSRAGSPPRAESPSKTERPPRTDGDPPREAAPARTAPIAPAPQQVPAAIAALASLDEIAEVVRSCTRCPLHRTATQGVPGEGNPDARLMLVGEAPGATEDQTGRPFVGQAGQLLTKILEAINFSRDDVFIVNVLKHRPPGNRNPMPDEVTACRPYLVRQVELVRPEVIIALGTFAAQTLLETKLAIGKLRGTVHQYHGVPVVVTYHPAALLRNPAWKRPTWEDVQLARRLLDSATA